MPLLHSFPISTPVELASPVSPSPQPSPSRRAVAPSQRAGRGSTHLSRFRQAVARRLFEERDAVHPLPEGEGWGALRLSLIDNGPQGALGWPPLLLWRRGRRPLRASCQSNSTAMGLG